MKSTQENILHFDSTILFAKYSNCILKIFLTIQFSCFHWYLKDACCESHINWLVKFWQTWLTCCSGARGSTGIIWLQENSIYGTLLCYTPYYSGRVRISKFFTVMFCVHVLFHCAIFLAAIVTHFTFQVFIMHPPRGRKGRGVAQLGVTRGVY